MSGNQRLEHISLGQAAKIAPGRPSTNCIWRWCRRGVIARSGERVRLRHVRAGGKIFTTADWVAEFCAALAAADARYFNAKDEAAESLPPRDARFGPPSRRRARMPMAAPTADDGALAESEFDAEGL